MSSQPSSPVYDTRNAQPVTRPTSICRARRNGHASFERSSSVSLARSSRDRGPATWSVAKPAVTSVTTASPGRPFRSKPIVRRWLSVGARTRNVDASRRVIVGSISIPPRSLARTVYTMRPTLDVQVRRRQPLEAGDRAGALDEELRVRREVVQRHACPGRLDLLAHRREPRRRPVVVADLGLDDAGLEPQRPLPAAHLAEGGAGRPMGVVQREPAQAARGLGLLAGPVHVVQAAQRLDGPFVEPAALRGPGTHPRHVDLGEVHRRVPLDDPLGGRPSDARPEDDPLRVQARGDEQARNLWDRAELEVRVRRERLGRPKEVLEPQALEARDPAPRLGEHGGDVVPVGPELREPSRRDAAGHERPAVGLERADDEAAAVVTDVQETVEVADERLGLDREVRLVGHHPHVLRRAKRDAGAGLPRELRGPESSGEDDGLRGDLAAGRGDAGDGATIAAHEPAHRRVRHVPDAAVDRPLGERERGEPRVDRAVGRVVGAAHQVVDRHAGPQLAEPVSADDLDVHAVVPGDRRAGEELVHPGLRPRDPQRPVPPQPGIDPGLGADALVGRRVADREGRERLRPADLRDEPGRVPRGAVGQAPALEQDDVAFAGRREVIGDRGTDDPAAHDDDPGVARELGGGQDAGDVEVAVGEVFGSRHRRRIVERAPVVGRVVPRVSALARATRHQGHGRWPRPARSRSPMPRRRRG